MKLDKLTIDFAQPKHLSQIVSLAQAYKLEGMTSREAVKRGFLVSNFEQEDYQAFLDRADHFYVLLEGDTVCGFVLAYSKDRIQDDSPIRVLMQSHYPGSFVVIKQICIRSDSIGKGLASSLYRHLFDRAQACAFFGAIVLEPLNRRSIDFHERHGFKKVFETTPSDGIPRGIWMRNPQSADRRCNEVEKR